MSITAFPNLSDKARSLRWQPTEQREKRIAWHITSSSMVKRRLMLASLRYLDTFVKMDGAWLFEERLLYVDWQEERAMS